MSNSLDPYQDPLCVDPILGPICLQRLSQTIKIAISKERFKMNTFFQPKKMTINRYSTRKYSTYYIKGLMLCIESNFSFHSYISPLSPIPPLPTLLCCCVYGLTSQASQQLWSCHDGQLTKPHFFPELTSTQCTYFHL